MSFLRFRQIALLGTVVLATLNPTRDNQAHSRENDESSSVAHGERIIAQEAATPSPELVSVQINYDFNNRIGPFSTGSASSLTFTPTVPIRINSEWNIVSRSTIPLVMTEGIFPGFGHARGLSNIQQSFFLSPVPKDPTLFWGIGPTFFLPTATSRKVGSLQTGSGLAIGILKAEGPFVFGLRLSQVWPVAGPVPIGLKPINFVYAEPMASYTTKDGWTYTLSAENVYDWNTSKLLVPINFTIEKLVMIQDKPINFLVGARFFAASPHDGPKGWGARIGMTILPFK
jgi:hypothetical protein